jgi:hypothetical protein
MKKNSFSEEGKQFNIRKKRQKASKGLKDYKGIKGMKEKRYKKDKFFDFLLISVEIHLLCFASR